ncbi:MAG: biotin transporter BioY [Acidobacteriia bacterium]|nr:biotin transporter BioY [Terriglobia bacterium]
MNLTSSNVLVDRLSGERSTARDLLWIVFFSLLSGLLAQIEIRLPFTPVPLTGQTFAVLLSGAVLGCRRGFLSQVAYLAEGLAGLPVFAGGSAGVAALLGPTGGYLWSFPLAAALLGWLVERGASRASWKLAGALILADSLILLVGASWLHGLFRFPYPQALLLGLYPFLIGDIVKVVLVGLSLPLALKRLPPSY